MFSARFLCTVCVLAVLTVFASVKAVEPEPLPTPEGEITAADIRGAYLVSVMRYVTWPNEDDRQALTIGILGTSAVYDSLRDLQFTPIRGKQIDVVSLSRSSQIPQVDLVYISPSSSTNIVEQVLSLAPRNHVLVITEDRVIRDRMMINIALDRDNRFSFQINDSRIQAAGLQTSEDLLTLRGTELHIVAANHQSLREMQAIDTTRQELIQQNQVLNDELEQLQDRIEALEQTLQERDDVLRAQEGSLEDKQLVMDSQQATLNALLSELEEQRQELMAREEQLSAIQRQLRDSERLLYTQERLLEEKELQLQAKERESTALAQRIASNRDILSAQQQQLRDQRAILADQTELLESRERTIDRQREYLVNILLALLVMVVLGVLSLVLYIKKRRTATKLMDALEELREAQDKLVESEKMAALGNLVAGVAHEVNTPLGVALTATSMLNDRREILHQAVREGKLTREQLERFLDQSHESLSLTEKNLSRVARLISNFKQVAVDQMVTDRRSIDLGSYIEEIMSALSIELKRAQITYTLDVESEIEMDTIPGAMAQILTNLVTNTIRHGYPLLINQDSLSMGQTRGTISIHAKRADADYIRLTFCDDGVGMDEVTVQRIFEPFFTTKRNEGGTGLGMPIVYNLVRQQLKGDISVRSTPGKGTCFELLLPRRVQI